MLQYTLYVGNHHDRARFPKQAWKVHVHDNLASILPTNIPPQFLNRKRLAEHFPTNPPIPWVIVLEPDFPLHWGLAWPKKWPLSDIQIGPWISYLHQAFTKPEIVEAFQKLFLQPNTVPSWNREFLLHINNPEQYTPEELFNKVLFKLKYFLYDWGFDQCINKLFKPKTDIAMILPHKEPDNRETARIQALHPGHCPTPTTLLSFTIQRMLCDSNSSLKIVHDKNADKKRILAKFRTYNPNNQRYIEQKPSISLAEQQFLLELHTQWEKFRLPITSPIVGEELERWHQKARDYFPVMAQTLLSYPELFLERTYPYMQGVKNSDSMNTYRSDVALATDSPLNLTDIYPEPPSFKYLYNGWQQSLSTH